MTQEDLFQAVKMFGPLARINCENHITIRNCADTKDLLTIWIKGEVDSDVRTQLQQLAHCLLTVELMRPCPKCKTKTSASGGIGCDAVGAPIASQYTEYFSCDECGFDWQYRPYA